MLELVTKETGANARLAEQEWKLAMRGKGAENFSALPAINLRPTFQGVNVVVRYIAPAAERYQIRTRLFESVVAVLHDHDASAKKSLPDNSKVLVSGQS
jgi:hypothetical protein